MSGTSLDGIDGVLVDFAPAGSMPLAVRAHRHAAFDADLRAELLALNRPGDDEIHRAAVAGNRLARRYAEVVAALLDGARVSARQVTAVGCHGQTVRHRPGEFDGIGYTVQLDAPALLAELAASMWSLTFAAPTSPQAARARRSCRPSTARFCPGRRGDGGRQPRRHRQPDGDRRRRVDPRLRLRPGECAPRPLVGGRHGQRFDCRRRLGGQRPGRPRPARRAARRAVLRLPPPKSTGRDLFHAQWLEERLVATNARARLAPEDIQATLAELTAATVADAVRRHAAARRELVVCGGGAFNLDLMPGSPPGSRRCPSSRARRAGCRRTRSRRAPSPGSPGHSSGASPATSRRSPARGRPRVLGALYPAVAPSRAERPPSGEAATGHEKAASRRLLLRVGSGQAEKLDPQPQVVVAFGFLITNWAPCRSSL
jgi:anhydro-N-acetylmuramic acid kinase